MAAEESRADGAAVYARDIEFLLTELPKHAGHFFALKKINWEEVCREFRDAPASVQSDADHLKLCARLMARLRDGHAGLVDMKVPWPDEARGRRWTGPRVHLLVIGDKIFVRAAFGQAEQLGLKAGQLVTRIDGIPAREWLTKKMAVLRDKEGYSTDHQALYAACHWGLADWSGTTIAFEVREADEAPKAVTITRHGGPNFAPIGPVFPPKNLKPLGRQLFGKIDGGIAYIHLRDVPGELPAQLDTMLAEVGDARGLILDMRANGGGGCDHAAVFGRFLPKDEYWGQYHGDGERPFGGPMVVIVDAGVRSAGETVAGMFKEESRAFTIGDTPTAGMSSQKTTLAVPSGLFSVRFSVRSNMRRYNDGRGLEGIGVSPHEVVPYLPDDLAAGIDTQIKRARQLLEKGFPLDEIDYVPPAARKK
jgi:carboxyl-terminal processing protease